MHRSLKLDFRVIVQMLLGLIKSTSRSDCSQLGNGTRAQPEQGHRINNHVMIKESLESEAAIGFDKSFSHSQRLVASTPSWDANFT